MEGDHILDGGLLKVFRGYSGLKLPSISEMNSEFNVNQRSKEKRKAEENDFDLDTEKESAAKQSKTIDRYSEKETQKEAIDVRSGRFIKVTIEDIENDLQKRVVLSWISSCDNGIPKTCLIIRPHLPNDPSISMSLKTKGKGWVELKQSSDTSKISFGESVP